MSAPKRTVLITGCSDGGLGAALAVALHKHGMHVYATARKESKMANLKSLGIETLELDVLSESSIAACVAKLTSLDMLVNNAGLGYCMPYTDTPIADAKTIFDVNVWAVMAVTHAFLPLLFKSRGVLVNHTSGASIFPVPMGSAYNASKAALAMFSATQRLELAPFGVQVVELKTNAVRSNILQNITEANGATLPKGSIYEPARDEVEKVMRGERVEAQTTADQWARSVAPQLARTNPPPTIWSGDSGWLASWVTASPMGLLMGVVKKLGGMDFIEQKLRQ